MCLDLCIVLCLKFIDVAVCCCKLCRVSLRSLAVAFSYWAVSKFVICYGHDLFVGFDWSFFKSECWPDSGLGWFQWMRKEHICPVDTEILWHVQWRGMVFASWKLCYIINCMHLTVSVDFLLLTSFRGGKSILISCRLIIFQ